MIKLATAIAHHQTRGFALLTGATAKNCYKCVFSRQPERISTNDVMKLCEISFKLYICHSNFNKSSIYICAPKIPPGLVVHTWRETGARSCWDVATICDGFATGSLAQLWSLGSVWPLIRQSAPWLSVKKKALYRKRVKPAQEGVCMIVEFLI